MTDLRSEYIAELRRELAMRKQVYPGRVMTRKMTQAAADKKIELMREVLVIFCAAETWNIPPEKMHDSVEIALPFYEPDGSPYPISDLSLHIKECQTEIDWRIHRLGKILGKATIEHAEYQLRLLRQITEILQRLQGEQTVKQTQLKLF